MASTKRQEAQEAPQPSERAAVYEQRYGELSAAAWRVVDEAERFLSGPDLIYLRRMGNPWIALGGLRSAIASYDDAYRAIIPSPDTVEQERPPLPDASAS